MFQDRVNRALEAEEKIIMGKELSIAKRQVRLSQNSFQQLMSHNDPFALNYDGESRDSSSNETSPSPIVSSKPLPPQSVPYSEGFVLELQQELVQARLREAECTSSLSELQVCFWHQEKLPLRTFLYSINRLRLVFLTWAKAI